MQVTWVGHASVLIETADTRLITDPLLTRRVAHLRRRRVLPTADVADVDGVLLSHAHLDHLHLASLRHIRRDTRILTPIGTGRLLRAAGFSDVSEVRVGDRTTIGAIEIVVVPAAHKPGRGPHSRVSAPPIGYLATGDGTRVYFPGDTDLFDEMAHLGDVDIALLPIWGWGSSLGTGHLDPVRAATATEIIRPGIVVPIHWGTYAPEDGRRRLPLWFDVPPTSFESALDTLGLTDRLRVVEPGGIVKV